MGLPTTEVAYTSAMPRREGHEVRKGHVGHSVKTKHFSDKGNENNTTMEKILF